MHDLLSVPELAERWRVSRGTIQTLLKKGEFPNAWRAGTRQYRIPLRDVEAYERKTRIGKPKEY